MAFEGKYLFSASMDVSGDKLDLFHEVYDKEHVPLLSKVPGVVSIARLKKQELVLAIGGKLETIEIENEPSFTALYELESPDVIRSDAWMEASEQGRWPGQERPFTFNRRHTLKRIM